MCETKPLCGHILICFHHIPLKVVGIFMLVSLLSKRNSGKPRGRFKVSQVEAQPGFGFGSPGPGGPGGVLLGTLANSHSPGLCGREALSPRRFDPSVLAVPVAAGMTDRRPWDTPDATAWPSQSKGPVGHECQILPRKCHMGWAA